MSRPDGKASLCFQPTDDRQLWKYDLSKDGLKISLPVYATPGIVDNEPYWLVIPAVPISEGPWGHLSAVLDPLSIHDGPDFWVIRHEDFKAEKCNGVTPEYYLRYPETQYGTGLTVRPIYGTERRQPVDIDFLQDMWQRTSVAELRVVRAVWQAICQELPRYLVATGKSVSFGFMELRCFPYRANWKQILLSRFPRILPVLRLPKEQRDDLIHKTGFGIAQLNTGLMALSGKAHPHTIGWTLECDLQPSWHQYIDGHENDVLATLGPRKYFQRAINLFDRFRVRALETFTRWVEQTARPCAAINRGRGHGLVRLVPAIRPNRVRPEGDGNLVVSITTPVGDPTLYDLDGDPYVAEPHQDLPPLPVVLLNSPDVWDDRGDVPAGGET